MHEFISIRLQSHSKKKKEKEIEPNYFGMYKALFTFCYKVIVLLLLILLSVIQFNKHLICVIVRVQETLRHWIDKHCSVLLLLLLDKGQWWENFFLRRTLTAIALIITLIDALWWRWIWRWIYFTDRRVKFHAISIGCDKRKMRK